MHIPDGVLSPSTSAVAGVIMLPVWAASARQAKQSLGTKQVPLLALGAAFCFTIMMFNIPALGGTTAHPVAGTLLAVLLGPWAAVIGVSTALAIQALFFGDGGVLAYGANCFTMAFVLPFVGFTLYRLLSGGAEGRSPRRAVAAAVGAYIGLNAGAAVVGLLLGLQPVLFHDAVGHAIYFPFGLKVTLPAMLGTHLLFASPAEAIVTGLVVRYLQTAGYSLYGCAESETAAGARLRRRETLWIGLLALAALSPLGILASGDAFGEWDASAVKEQMEQHGYKGYVPRGYEQAEQHGYKGIPSLRDYAQPEEGKSYPGYIGAALLGVSTISTLLLLAGRLLTRGEKSQPLPQVTTFKSQASDETPVGLPDWLRQPSGVSETAIDQPKRPRNRYLEHTLATLAESATATLREERWANRPGLLQRLDPRARLIGMLALIVTAACLRQALPLICLCLLSILCAVASRLPLGPFLRRVWFAVPLFMGAIVLPQTLNIVTPGRALITLWHHPYLAVTVPGLAGAGLLILRVGVVLSFGTLLTLSSRRHDLLHALRALGVPRLFLAVLMMTHRYIMLLMQTASEMFIARRSRTVGILNNRQGRRFVGSGMGALFAKTFALSEEVHAAMLARGYNGELRTLTRSSWRLADTLWTLTAFTISLLILGSDHVRIF